MSDQLLNGILSELKTLNQRVGHIETDVAGVKADINVKNPCPNLL